MTKEKPRRSRKRRRCHGPSTGVILQGRAAGLGHWDDETGAKWTKPKLHRRVRARLKAALRRETSHSDA
ncbi:hypothetical protein ABZ892_33130 [Streptomyces sp. NPDC046924]|uniref:hypothetical protein n=1 Tax=Streptomyces sp. NPDC046924 TaxID=3155136 RepID=UPI003408D6AF